ncbi:MAG: alpha/beta fold hydrolase [Polyangiales bacterium]
MISLVPLLEKLGQRALVRGGHRRRWVDTRAGKVHVYDARGLGPLPPIAMIHGIGSTAIAFAPVLAHLRRRARRIIAFELPGHGSSQKVAERLTPDLLFDAATDGLDAALDEPTVVVGNSLGGAVALHYAIARPHRVRALIMVSPAAARMSEGEIDALRSSFAIKNRRDAVRFLDRIVLDAPFLMRVLAHELVEMLGRKHVREILESASPDHAPEPHQLAKLTMPILLVWGREERLFPPTALEWFRKNLPPHAQILEPAGFGHAPHLDRPADVAATIEDFVRSLPRS